jgi:hypothetical protein
VAAGSGSGIRVAAQDSSSAVVEIDGNTVTGVAFDNGIENVARNGKGRLDATVSDNNISVGASANSFIRSAAGSSGSAHTNKTCVWIKNNVLTGGPAFQHHEGRVVNAHELILQGGGTTMEESWNNNANSPASPPAVMNPFISGAGVISFAGACATPAHALPF